MHNDPPRPERLWKYRKWDDYAQRMITHGELHFSLAAELNDPYECYWKDQFPVSLSELHRWAQAFCERYHPEDTTEQHRVRIDCVVSWAWERSTKENTGFLPSSVITTVGLCCLATLDNNILMWAHYAAYHTGVCIGVRTNCFSRHRILPVIYSESVPAINVWSYLGNREEFVTASRTKCIHWNYEEEWRIVDQPGQHRTPRCVDRVVLGLKASAETRREVWDAIDAAGYPIEVFEARRSDTKFCVDIFPATR